MRLLHAKTHTLHEFSADRIPAYAILSHTWGSHEVTYANLQSPLSTYSSRPAWNKILLTCEQALRDGLHYAWVDTCCIDKSSSAELSEAINSMFAYYRDAAACYAYLSDVRDTEDMRKETLELALSDSRWFTRGWTLQELLAPTEVMFYDSNWSLIGSRTQLSRRISVVTGIESSILRGEASIQSACVARRMFWASHRQTTRPEDLAYCMLGLFDIHMPTLYGEGDKAFQRLQEEILRTSDDHSLFAWVDTEASEKETSGLLAKSPQVFQHSANVVAFRDWTEPSLPFSMSNSGLSITLPLDHEEGEVPSTPQATATRKPSLLARASFKSVSSSLNLPSSIPTQYSPGPSSLTYRAYLNCSWSNDRSGHMYVQLRLIGSVTQQYCRTKLWSTLQSTSPPPKTTPRQIFIRQLPTHPQPQDIVDPQPFVIDLQRGEHASDYALRAYLHADRAVSSKKNWFSTLMKQAAFNEQGGDPVFFIPGQPRQLALVLLLEYLPTFSKFCIMIGSGHNSHLPMMDYRVIRPSEHVLFNDIQHFLRASRVVSAGDRSFTAKRIDRIRGWLDQFRFAYDPLIRNDAYTGVPLAKSGTRTCSKFAMSGVDHHVQLVRVDDVARDDGTETRGRIMVRLRIGGHMYDELGKEDTGLDGCSSQRPNVSDRVRSETV